MISSPSGLVVALGIGAVLGGCSADKPESRVPACLDVTPDADCTTALYADKNGNLPPTYADVFAQTLKPTCARPGCHTGGNAANGLAFDDEAASYDALLDENAAGTNARLIPGNVKCGEFVVRLETRNTPWSMPQGGHLDEATLCSIRHFVADGAPRE